MRPLAYLLVALALLGCDEKRMGRTPGTKKPMAVPYESHYSDVPSVHLKVVRMSPGETQTVMVDGGVKMTKWDDTVVEVTNIDGGVSVRAVRQGSALIQGTDATGLEVDLPVQVFPPLK